MTRLELGEARSLAQCRHERPVGVAEPVVVQLGASTGLEQEARAAEVPLPLVEANVALILEDVFAFLDGKGSRGASTDHFASQAHDLQR